MRWIKIEVRDFCAHRCAVLDLEAVSLAVVTGRNGAGKSSLCVDAPLWALYGEARGATLADVVRRGAKTARVVLEFEASGARWRVVRAYTIKGKTGQTLLELWRWSGAEWSAAAAGSVAEVQTAIHALLGLSCQALCVASIVRQGEASALTLATPGERLAALLEVCGGAHLEGLASAAARVAARAYEAVELKTALSVQTRGQLERLREQAAARALELERVEVEASKLAALEAAADEAGAAATSASALIERLEAARAQDQALATALSRCADAEGRLLATLAASSKLDVKRDQLQQQRRGESSEALLAELGEVEARAAHLGEQRTQAAALISQAAALEGVRRERAEQLQRLAAQTARATEAAAAIPVTCEARGCGARLYVAAARGAELDRLAADVAALEVERAALISQAKELALAQLTEDMASAAATVDQHGADQVLAYAQREVMARAAGLRGALAVNAKIAHEAGEVERDRMALARTEERLREEMAREQEAADNARAAGGHDAGEVSAAREQEIRQARDLWGQALEALNSAKKGARAAALAAEAARVDEAVLDSLEVEAAARALELEALEREAAAERERWRVATLARDFLRAAPLVAVARALPRLEAAANELLADLAPQMRLCLSTARTSRKGDLIDALTITLEVAGRAAPVETLSGGERFRVDLALRLALARLASGRAAAPVQTLIIDEGFGALDEAGCALAVEALAALQTRFPLILAISHVEQMRALLPVLEIQRPGDTIIS